MSTQVANKPAETPKGFTLRKISDFSASKQARAKKLQMLTAHSPELRAAYLSRSNEAFRKMAIKIARAAASEDAAYQLLSLLPLENQSAAIQFAADVFDEVAKAKGEQVQIIDVESFDISKLMS
jgi:hypothetical protein